MTELKKVTVEEWVEALRSGKYKQSQAVLNCDAGFCCLGVLADLAGAKWEDYQDSDYPGLKKFFVQGDYWYGSIPPEMLPNKHLSKHTLINMNDSGETFSEIADCIEAQVNANS